MLRNLLMVLHGFLSFAIVGLVLLQRGKGADAGAGFGAGASGTVFGARGSATFFSKMTAVLATLFFMSSMSLAWFATRPLAERPSSVVDTLPLPAAEVPAGIDSDAPPALAAPEPAPPAPAGE